jgi:hypothetical protein
MYFALFRSSIVVVALAVNRSMGASSIKCGDKKFVIRMEQNVKKKIQQSIMIEINEGIYHLITEICNKRLFSCPSSPSPAPVSHS